MFQNSGTMQYFSSLNFVEYFKSWSKSPINLIIGLLDIAIVIFLVYKAVKILRKTRAWQLLKGIAILIILTLVTGWLNFGILNAVLNTLMTYGAFILIVVFQPELRRMLEQLGTTSKLRKFFGVTKNLESKTKETVYQVVIAATELAKNKTGALIVLERDIKIKDIIETGIAIDSEVSPQLLVNIFVPNTPLHDGAVVISDNKIAAASCMLPLSDNQDISKELGTRHRAAIGLSNQCDSIVVVVSEETGKISVAKDGTLIADVKEDALKKILLKNMILEGKSTLSEVSEKKDEKAKNSEEE
jgi:diadenylate cyclase